MTRFETSYFDSATTIEGLAEVIERAERDLTERDFDTIVATGLSGTVVAPALALHLSKKFLIVRKDRDGSHHSGKLVGTLGERWIFLDDFTSSGATLTRVHRAVTTMSMTYSTFVGSYLYETARRLDEGFGNPNSPRFREAEHEDPNRLGVYYYGPRDEAGHAASEARIQREVDERAERMASWKGEAEKAVATVVERYKANEGWQAVGYING